MQQIEVKEDIIVDLDTVELIAPTEELLYSFSEPPYERCRYLQDGWMHDLVQRAYMCRHDEKEFAYLKHVTSSAQHYAQEFDMPLSFVRDARQMAEDRVFKRRLIRMIEQECAEKERRFIQHAVQAITREERLSLTEVMLSPEAWERGHQ